MPILTNSRHEKFAQARFAGKSIDDAYIEAGFSRNRSNASRLNANEHIQSRIAELQERAVRGVVVDRQWVIDKLVDNVNKADKREDGSVVNRGLELLGKELGMFVDRKEIRTGPLDEATPDELERLREELVAERDRRLVGGDGTSASRKPH